RERAGTLDHALLGPAVLALGAGEHGPLPAAGELALELGAGARELGVAAGQGGSPFILHVQARRWAELRRSPPAPPRPKAPLDAPQRGGQIATTRTQPLLRCRRIDRQPRGVGTPSSGVLGLDVAVAPSLQDHPFVENPAVCVMRADTKTEHKRIVLI